MKNKTLQLERSDIVKWLEEELELVHVHPDSDNYIGYCPFCDPDHEHKNDFGFNVDKMVGNCYRHKSATCEVGFRIFRLVQEFYEIDEVQAYFYVKKNFQDPDEVNRLKKQIVSVKAEEIDIDDNEDRIIVPLPRGSKKALSMKKTKSWLIDTRDFPKDFLEDMVKPVYLGNSPRQRTMWGWRDRVFFPVSSAGNKAWIAYNYKKVTDKRPKTRNPPGSVLSKMLFFYDFFTESKKPVLLCEGIFDAMRLYLFGFNAVAVFGVNVTVEQIALLNSLPAKEVVVCLDPDAYVTKKNKKTGKKVSAALTMAKKLKEMYLGKVSMMQLENDDPDESSFHDVKKAFSNRWKMSNDTWRLANKLRSIRDL